MYCTSDSFQDNLLLKNRKYPHDLYFYRFTYQPTKCKKITKIKNILIKSKQINLYINVKDKYLY